VTDEQDLYGLPLDRFVPERGALAKALRKRGRREEAREVSSLRKPAVAAWAVNQLVRTRSREVAALFDAGDVLQQAQTQLLTGRGDGRALREAVGRERDAVRELAELARGLLSSDGHEVTQTTLDRVSDTLHAAALDGDARAQVTDGRLARELRHVGLGQTSISNAGDPNAARRAGANEIERERTQRLKAARKAEADARRAAERAERDLNSTQARRGAAADSLREAEEALAAAREHTERAKLEHARAEQALDRL
jgi:hypothetical protein